jgi:hypothetical protein
MQTLLLFGVLCEVEQGGNGGALERKQRVTFSSERVNGGLQKNRLRQSNKLAIACSDGGSDNSVDLA